MNEYQIAILGIQDAFKGLTSMPVGVHGFGGYFPNSQTGQNTNLFSLTGQPGYPFVQDTN